MSNHWSAWQPNHVAHRRAGGRRRYNAERQLSALIRRLVLVENFDLFSLMMVHGTKARAARFLGVSAATISRDITAIFRGGY
ncbi:MAG: hypothetical protein JNM09_06825 [Blastocatellia bacterium]|nr:hypothetical protein [Blastocatellia bacterium]